MRFVAIAIAAVSYCYITIQISIWLGKLLRISYLDFLPIEEWRDACLGAGLYHFRALLVYMVRRISIWTLPGS